MGLSQAEKLADQLTAAPASAGVQLLVDQLWLRSVMIEQWRRTRLAERDEFEARADRLLAALDPIIRLTDTQPTASLAPVAAEPVSLDR